MKIWSVVIAVMLIFGAGVVTGGLLVRTRVVQVAPPRPANLGGPTANLAPGRQAFVQRVRRELNLTPDQSRQVERIMRESHKRMAKVYEPIAPEAREETRRVRQEILAILSPDQKKKFNEATRRRQRDLTQERRSRPNESNTFARPHPKH